MLDAKILLDALCIAVTEIDDDEFDTRIGVSKELAYVLTNRLIRRMTSSLTDTLDSEDAVTIALNSLNEVAHGLPISSVSKWTSVDLADFKDLLHRLQKHFV